MNRRNQLVRDFTRRYASHLSGLTRVGPRTYGFEYEFLPDRPPAASDMRALAQFLAAKGFSPEGSDFVRPGGLRVNFEPGGQIEYNSPPLTAYETERLPALLGDIEAVNMAIFQELGLRYLAVGYLPGRKDAPLCLTTDRYRLLHDRLARVGDRGLEMMKGTASIHLHVGIAGMAELLPLFSALCRLAVSEEFQMGPDRRDIWDRTDPLRCGLPPCCFAALTSPEALIERLIRFAMDAPVLGEDKPFDRSRDLSFEAFLYHMTTLFTDVRFNLKGPTLELRTLDSMPPPLFIEKWRRFVALMETTCPKE